MFTSVGMITLGRLGGGGYGVVSERGCALLGLCVDHDFMLVAYVFLMHVIHVLVAFSWC